MKILGDGILAVVLRKFVDVDYFVTINNQYPILVDIGGLSRYTHHIAKSFWESKPQNYDVEESESIDKSRKEIKKRIRVRKRSAGHVRQCRRLLMTVCCRVFYTPIYIGYRLK